MTISRSLVSNFRGYSHRIFLIPESYRPIVAYTVRHSKEPYVAERVVSKVKFENDGTYTEELKFECTSNRLQASRVGG